MYCKKERLLNSIENANLVIDLINQEFSVDSRSSTQKREVVTARQMCMYFIYEYINLSTAEIGKLFTNKKGEPYDHSTVVHSKKMIKNLMEVDKEVRRDIYNLEDRVKEIAKLEIKNKEKSKLINQIKNTLVGKTLEELKQLNNQLN